jgi:hypothetical protein
MILFTIVGIVLYFAADRALNALEVRAGRRFEYRSLIFFAILLPLALLTFALLQRFTPGD